MLNHGVDGGNGEEDLTAELRSGWLAGNEMLEVNQPVLGFLKVGERCNVAGSRKFLRLISEGKQAEALEIAAGQIDKGAGVLDINMDDALLDAPSEMERFVTLLGQDVRTAKVPLMVDSSDMEVIRRALHRIQGKPIVNSISLKEGEEKFLERAREIREAGASVVVMAFDENGQAIDFARRIEICERAYRLLTEQAGYAPQDIIFDPNVLTIATGIAEHDRYALDFLEAVEWIKRNLPGAKVSGGVSNLSFSFRGNNKLREAMHAVFLEHAIKRGMDMAIVNPTTALSGECIDRELRERIEDVIFMRRDDATERLMEIAAESKAQQSANPGSAGKGSKPKPEDSTNSGVNISEGRIEEMIRRGIGDGIEPLLDDALLSEGSAMGVVNNRLMSAMSAVGDEFGAGRMFLPQVVRAAGVMKRAIDYLTPAIEAEASKGGENESGGIPFVIATVKGDVHDIGKNIVGVILKCGGFR
ncbi:MAG: dihydropteroate synthase, partial [Muribaculaceae bacterium]|nr:dihydropteroate synthase [Muribaculaceae bacterium]